MSAEEERQAMLEKIRADMAQSRQRLAAMRERKARGTILLQSSPIEAEQKPSEAQNKFAAASTNIMEKLKAEREAKRAQIQEKKSVTGESVPIAKTDGPLKAVQADNKPITPSIQVTPNATAADNEEKEETDQKSLAPTDAPSNRKNRSPSGKNIRSLADLQKAIKKADRVKQSAQTQGKIAEMRRERDNRRKKAMTREERRAYRQSKRLTVELSHSEARVKVDQQIGKFMKMIQLLETEWQKGEEDRIKREQEMEEQRLMFEKATDQMEFLSKSLLDMSNQMEEMKVDLEDLASTASKGVKKEEKWFSGQFMSFQNNFLDMRHQAYVSAMKQKKVMSQTQQEAEKIAKDLNAPPPPLPPPTAGAPSSNPITNLLAQIRSGTSLKKLDPDQVEKERSERKGNWRQSVQLLQGLQDTLRDTLDQRHLALFSDEEDEEEYDDEDWE